MHKIGKTQYGQQDVAHWLPLRNSDREDSARVPGHGQRAGRHIHRTTQLDEPDRGIAGLGVVVQQAPVGVGVVAAVLRPGRIGPGIEGQRSAAFHRQRTPRANTGPSGGIRSGRTDFGVVAKGRRRIRSCRRRGVVENGALDVVTDSPAAEKSVVKGFLKKGDVSGCDVFILRASVRPIDPFDFSEVYTGPVALATQPSSFFSCPVGLATM